LCPANKPERQGRKPLVPISAFDLIQAKELDRWPVALVACEPIESAHSLYRDVVTGLNCY
jgi:hypothetical protein